MFKEEKGMTLYALVFTIIAMLALAAVAVAMVLDEFKYDPKPVQVYTEQREINEETASPEATTTPERPATEVTETEGEVPSAQ